MEYAEWQESAEREWEYEYSLYTQFEEDMDAYSIAMSPNPQELIDLYEHCEGRSYEHFALWMMRINDGTREHYVEEWEAGFDVWQKKMDEKNMKLQRKWETEGYDAKIVINSYKCVMRNIQERRDDMLSVFSEFVDDEDTSAIDLTRFRVETDQATRWLAFALTEVEQGFRRISGWRDLSQLVRALARSDDDATRKRKQQRSLAPASSAPSPPAPSQPSPERLQR